MILSDPTRLLFLILTFPHSVKGIVGVVLTLSLPKSHEIIEGIQLKSSDVTIEDVADAVRNSVSV